jgi:hypothetical protein
MRTSCATEVTAMLLREVEMSRMTPEEAKARIAAQNTELAGLEDEISRLATTHSGPVLMAIVRALVEAVSASQGDIFRVHNKIRFYHGVLRMLHEKGIS